MTTTTTALLRRNRATLQTATLAVLGLLAAGGAAVFFVRPTLQTAVAAVCLASAVPLGLVHMRQRVLRVSGRRVPRHVPPGVVVVAVVVPLWLLLLAL